MQIARPRADARAHHSRATNPACRPHSFMGPALLPQQSTTPPSPGPYDSGRPTRTNAITAAAQACLRPLCADWPPEQFSALISDVVRFRERWDAWDALQH
ncbi:hypothetical protein tb265_19000 [Gemmatimonadetes bacterium T265]|nr:hypothetical protein tb265_19000 [Gemmatimonadetes bacterium T265]